MAECSAIIACDNCRYSGSTVGHASFAQVGKPCPNCRGGRFIEYVSAPKPAVEALRRIVWAENRGPDAATEVAYMAQVARDAIVANEGRS